MAAARHIRAALLFFVVDSCRGWIFTEVKYNPEWRSLGAGEHESWYSGTDVRLNEIDVEEQQERFILIYPGTRWCGAGNVASGYEDLGPAREADKCCREHDHCEDVIASGDTRHNLTNTAFYTRLSCACDERFRRCLRAAGTRSARRVGVLYFDALGTECFQEEFPTTGCKRRGGFLNSKCLEYSYDTSGERRHQWFDVPLF